MKMQTLWLALMLLAALAACGGQTAKSPDPAEEPLGEIGKSFDQIQAAHPDAKHLMTTVPGAAGLCLGEEDGPYYFFFGAQDGPTLEELSGTHGGQLKCAGIGTTVGVLYPEAGEETAVEQFCADHEIAEYLYTTENAPGQNWLIYDSGDKTMWLYTEKGDVIGRDDRLYVIDQALELENLDLREEYRRAEQLTYTSLIVDGRTYVQSEPFDPEPLFADAEQWQEGTERYYRTEGCLVTTTMAAEHEYLSSMEVWGEGETQAGIRIGSTLEEVKAAYPAELSFLNGVFDTGLMSGVPYTRAYAVGSASPSIGIYTNMVLFVNDGKVVKLRISGGMDFGTPEVVLGMENLHWEHLAESGETRYFTENADGTETQVLRIQGGSEHHDLDGDGILEILVPAGTDNSRNYGIYDRVDGNILFTDVKGTLEAQWASFLGDVSNLTDDTYCTCFQVGMEAGKDGDVYSYADGKLTYACTFAHAMGWE